MPCLDIAIWLDSLNGLNALRRAGTSVLSRAYKDGTLTTGIVSQQVDTFLFESKSQQYVGRLCSFNQCPKGKPSCFALGCGVIPFNKQIEGFVPRDDLLAGAVMLYKRDIGRVSLAAALPQPDELQNTKAQ